MEKKSQTPRVRQTNLINSSNLFLLPKTLVTYLTNINLAFEQPVGMTPIVITKVGIVNLLNGLDPNKSTGPDGISTKLLQLVPEVISSYLELIFSRCLQTCTMPADWKLANVVPVFKKGSKSTPGNYS